MVDDNPEVGVWEGVLEEEELGEWQENTLLASSEEEAKRASAPINVGFQAAVAANELVPHTLSIEVADTPGVLNMVTGVIARRGYNIQSLAVGNSEAPGRSRITCTLPATRSSIAKLLKQLNKLVSVHKVVDLTELPTVARELLLVKLRCLPSQRGELRDLSQIFRANIVDVGVNTLTLEVMGKDLKAEGILAVLEPYGMLEVARTGRVALARDSGVSSKYLEKTQATRVW